MESLRIAVLVVHAVLCKRNPEGGQAHARTAAEFCRRRCVSRGTAIRSAHTLQEAGTVDSGNVVDVRYWPDYFLTGEILLVMRGRVVSGGIRGDFADGSDKYAYPEPRSG